MTGLGASLGTSLGAQASLPALLRCADERPNSRTRFKPEEEQARMPALPGIQNEYFSETRTVRGVPASTLRPKSALTRFVIGGAKFTRLVMLNTSARSSMLCASVSENFFCTEKSIDAYPGAGRIFLPRGSRPLTVGAPKTLALK